MNGYTYELSREQRDKNELKTCIKFLLQLPDKYRGKAYYRYYWNRTVAAFVVLTQPMVDELWERVCAWYLKDGLTVYDRELALSHVEIALTDPQHIGYANDADETGYQTREFLGV